MRPRDVHERKLHRFRESMIRGYVRMAASCKNIQLDDRAFDPPPQSQLRTPRMSGRKCWIDLDRYVPDIEMGDS